MASRSLSQLVFGNRSGREISTGWRNSISTHFSCRLYSLIVEESTASDTTSGWGMVWIPSRIPSARYLPCPSFTGNCCGMPWVYTVTVRTFCTEREEETAGVEEGEGETGSAEHPKAAKRHAASRGKRRNGFFMGLVTPCAI